MSLNPCSNGRYSQSNGGNQLDGFSEVLILVLMEDTHRDDEQTETGVFLAS